MGVSRAQLSKYELGQSAPPCVLTSLAKDAGKSVDWILTGKGQAANPAYRCPESSGDAGFGNCKMPGNGFCARERIELALPGEVGGENDVA